MPSFCPCAGDFSFCSAEKLDVSGIYLRYISVKFYRKSQLSIKNLTGEKVIFREQEISAEIRQIRGTAEDMGDYFAVTGNGGTFSEFTVDEFRNAENRRNISGRCCEFFCGIF